MVLAQHLSRSALFISAGFAAFASGATAQSYTVLHRFTGAPNDGDTPYADLRADSEGSLYGTTRFGGTKDYGTIFKVATDGTETLLYSFTGGKDDEYPSAGVTVDQKTGDLYGTASGNSVVDCDEGCGIIWKLTARGRFSILHMFDSEDGSFPYGRMIRDRLGNFYGTTVYGGSSHNCTYGCGVVWELTAGGKYRVLHNFSGMSTGDGEGPLGRLARDRAGNLYGATGYGGYYNGYYGYGTIYKIAPSGAETVLYSFTNGSDGAYPSSGLVRDKAANLYGTTDSEYYDTVFRLTPDGTLTTVLNLGTDDPEGDLLRTRSDWIYGTTYAGGNGAGNVYELSPNGTLINLHSFTDTEHPWAGVLKIKDTLYGTTAGGDGSDHGVVFSLTIK